MFSDGPQNMFRYEHGDIRTGVCEIIAKPVISGKICSDEMLADKLKEYICHAKHYVFDDWSLVVAYKGLKSVRNINPVSLDKIFMEEFNKIVGGLVEKYPDEFETYWQPRITEIIEKYLGKGMKVSQCSRAQVEALDLIVTELRDIVK